jgi:hypothetical protein
MRTFAYFFPLPLVAALMVGCDTVASDPPANPSEDGATQVEKPEKVAAKGRKKKEPGVAPARIPVRKDL